MKEVLFFFSLITIVSCSYVEPEMDEVDHNVTESALDFYLDEFEYQAALRGFSIDLDKLGLETVIERIDDGNVAGTCHYSSRYPNRVTINKAFWEKATDLMREMVVFHELGHCVLSRGHREDATADGICLSIMQSGLGSCQLAYNSANRRYYVDELFLPGGI